MTEEEHTLELHSWGWSGGHTRLALADCIDREEAFCFRPYVDCHYLGMEGLHPIYQEALQGTRNNKAKCAEGIYDFWGWCSTSSALPGFVITDPFSPTGGLLWPFVYRPDRVCRQLGWDQPPCNVAWPFISFREAIRSMLYKDELPPMIPLSLFLAPVEKASSRATQPTIML